MFDSLFSNYDSSYEPVFEASWSHWEEYGWIIVFEKNKQYFSLRGGHCVYVPGDDSVDFKTDLIGPLSEEDILDILTEWEEN